MLKEKGYRGRIQGGETMSKLVERMGDLELLPITVLQTILGSLDVANLCSVAASCRLLRVYAKEALQELESVHIPRDTFLNWKEVDIILAGNSRLKSLDLDCVRLIDAKELNNFTKPTLEDLALYNCDTLSSSLLVEIGQQCSSLRCLRLQFGSRGERSARGIFSCNRDGGYSKGLELLLAGCKQLESLCLRWDALLRIFDTDAFESIPRLTEGSLKSLELGFLAERDARSVLEGLSADVPQQISNPPSCYPLLERLCLSLNRITDSLVATIAANLPQLKDLDLSDEPTEEPLLGFDLTNVGVITIGTSLRQLCHVSLVRKPDSFTAFFKRVSDLGILLLGNGCEELETVRLGGFSRVTDAGIKSFLTSCPRLTTFELSNMNQVTDLLFHDFPATPVRLQGVTLSSCHLLTDATVVRVAECRSLQSVDLKNCKSIGDESLKALSCLPQLKTLLLNGTDVSDYGLWWLGQGVTPLSRLSLRHCVRLTSRGIHSLFARRGFLTYTLEFLDLSGINLTNDAVSSIACSGIELCELWLRDCPLLTSESIAKLADSPSAKSLRFLDLWNSKGIKEISRWFRKPYFPRLRFLGVPKTMNAARILDLAEARPTLMIKRSGRRNSDWMGECVGMLDALSEGSITEEDLNLDTWFAEGELL
ncbi:hypothetical protein R1sor_023284 [Riccia sorocarpa]|uniref:F-box/LRR-repeat protein 15-like leucin rich repeat domain-containing protein n=1 Tax=Riccia sorocarpa TaxID=122646 RepID=A0ABD3GM74_9MARC